MTHDPVESLARLGVSPTRIALRFAGESVTYGELDRRSGHVAAELAARGIGADSLVGLALPRSAELVIWVWGCWRAGAAFLPLDPAYPRDRLAFMIEDAKPALVVDEATQFAAAPWTDIARGPDDLAYVIYTSGSTGRPKGVEIPFRGLVNLAAAQREAFAIAADSRVLQFASPSFDAFVAEVISALLAGASLHIPTESEAADLAGFCKREAITVATFPPSLLAILEPRDFPTLATVVAAGEACSAELARRWSDRRFVNAYGPTEATVCAIEGVVEELDGVPPIGRPLPGVEVVVIDDELYIGGIGLARGYRHRPDLTAAAFVIHEGRRLYRTGDLVRRDAVGRFYFVGRRDDQIKLRGYRIELGEVEHAVRGLRAIADAAVVVRGDQLVAHVVARGAFDARAALDELARALPAHMIPAAIVEHTALPRSPAGKVDRKALARWSSTYERPAYVAPSTATEQALARIWTELLGVELVGTGDAFFALGGTSLSALRMIARVREQHGVELSLRSVFAGKTLAGVAHEIDHAGPSTTRELASDDAMSFAQQRLWFLDQLDPGSCAYNIAFGCRLRGALDVAALHDAFARLVERHASLRSVFPAVSGEPRVTKLPGEAFTIRVEHHAGDRDAIARQRLEEETLVRFDLERGPLLRARLLKFAADDHALVIAVHHIVFDGWSLAVFWRDLSALYRGPLPPLDAPVERRATVAIDRWKCRLQGAPFDLALPVTGPRPSAGLDRGRRVEVAIDLDLDGLARRLGGTRFTVLLAALRLLLARITGQNESCIGTAFGNRGDRFEDLIGFFVNTLVLRGRVEPRERFAELVARETADALDAFADADTPFHLVVDALGVARTMQTPIIQVMLIDQGTEPEPELPGIRAESVRTDVQPVDFDLLVEARERRGVRTLSVTYREAMFERATIETLLERYVRVLRTVSADPERACAEIDLLDERERQQLFVAPGRVSRPSIVDAIEQQMRARPDAAAVIGETTTSYGELDRRTRNLAALLRVRGVAEDVTVAVLADRGPALVTAALAVLRAGGAYVPIRPDLPAERIARMLADSAPRAILYEGARPTLAGFDLIPLDGELPSGSVPARATAPDALAYVMFTSGSTGRPKGVMQTRRAFDGQLGWWQAAIPLTRSDRVVQLASPVFDTSIPELFWTLASGAAIVTVPPRTELEPRTLAQLAQRHGATVVQFVPSLLRIILDARDPWPTIRIVLAAGEALALDLVRNLPVVFPHAELYNGYGPTETIYATCWRCDPGDTSVPIGRAVRDTAVYVLDDALAPAPPGHVGELWIAGGQLARGYIGRAALTAERFVPDPFAIGERMYRSGDLVRQRPDGVLEYIGRRDFQLKLRGFRIELGEIEAVLHAQPRVRAASVVAREVSPRGTVLVAYVCGDVTGTDLRAACAQQLPEYMVPSAFVVLEALPLTPTGKLDRNALPTPMLDGASSDAPPRTATERALVRIWCAILGIEHVGIHTNFFACGGHSLLVTRLVARITSELGVDMRAREVFERPTIAEQAERIDRGRVDTGDDLDSNPNRPLPSHGDGPTPITFAQQLHWDLHVRGEYPAVNIHVAAYAMRGPLDIVALQRAVAALVERHAALRMTFSHEHGRVVQTARSGAFELPVIERSQDAVRERFLEAARPHDLSREAFRAELVRVSDREHVLLLTPHHIVLDGHSSMVLDGDLAALYRGETLAPLALSFTDFCFWQRTLEQRPVGRAQGAYWERAVAGYMPLELPGDVGAPARSVLFQTYRAGQAAFAIDGEAWRAVERACARLAVTPYMIVATAFTLLLARWARRADVCTNSSYLHRDRPGSEKVIGMFVTQYPLRVRFDLDGTLESAVHDLQRTVLANREQQQVAPVAAAAQHLIEWSRYNFNYLIDEPADARGFGEVTVERLPWNAFEPRTVHDLGVWSRQTAHGLRTSLAYNAERFSPAQIERVIVRFCAILRAVTDSPHLRVRDLPHDP